MNRRYNLLSFILIILAAIALSACTSAEAGFEPGLTENDLSAISAENAEPAAAGETMSLAQLVANLDAELNSVDYVATAGCTYGIGYWKNHPASWDGETLTLGATEYTTSELLSILNTPPRGDASYILAQQLIAAKLNGASETDLADAITAADDWLAANPLDSAAAGDDRQGGILLAELLDDYNNGYLGADACEELEDEDVDDKDDADVDDVDDDEDQSEERADGNCTGADPHPHATVLAENYDVTYDEIMDRFCDGYGFGEIEIAYLLADEAGVDVEEIYALRDAGMGWGNIRKEVGASPGLGKDKPKKDRDGDLPPGLEKKDGDRTPPGLEKKDKHTSPGHAKKDD